MLKKSLNHAIRLSFCVSILLIFPISSVHAAGPNLILNPDFEGGGSGSVANWIKNVGTLEVENVIVNSGDYSANATTASGTRISAVSNAFSVDSSTQYNGDLYIFLADSEGSVRVFVIFLWYNATGYCLGPGQISTSIVNGSWFHHTGSATSHADAVTGRIEIYTTITNHTYSLFIDDVQAYDPNYPEFQGLTMIVPFITGILIIAIVYKKKSNL